MNVSMTFHGMCAFARQDGRTDALLLPEKDKHRPVLAIPVAHFVIPNSLDPDMVGHNGADEIAFWDLRGVTLEVGNDIKDPVWRNLNAGFALGLYHPGAKPKPLMDLRAAVGQNGSTIEVTSGTFEFLLRPVVNVKVSRDINGVKQPVVTSEFPSAVRWSGSTKPKLVLKKGGKNSVIELLSSADPELSITNVARMASPGGLEHFSEYYGLVDLAGGDGPLVLEDNNADITVYDCVPPVGLPMP